MAGRGRAVGSLVKWGVKYGPHVVVLAQQAREPAMAMAQKALARQRAQRRAVEHAATVQDGAVLKAFDPRGDASEPLWVVFSGEEPIASHPATTTPLSEVVARCDLTLRRRPEEHATAGRRATERLRRLRR